MPIKVFCPNGCVIRMPSNRAGKIVRCPECKSVIRLDRKFFDGNARPDQEKKVKARLHQLEKKIGEQADVQSDPNAVSDAQSTSKPTSKPVDEVPVLKPIPTPRLDVPNPVIDLSKKTRPEKPDRSRPEQSSNKSRPNVPLPKPIVQRQVEELEKPAPIVFSKNGEAKNDEPADEKLKLRKKAKSARLDRETLSRFFAACLCLAALLNLGPAIYYWSEWSQEVDGQALPRWIYLQAFVAAIHFVYAIYLIQIPDWSALRSVGFAMLGFAVMFGIVSTGLVVGGGGGIVSQFLELPYVLVGKATIWCVAMLILSTLLCFVIGREAVNWQRTENLLEQILSGKTNGA